MKSRSSSLRKWRLQARLSQVDVAKTLGYSSQFVANWERGVSSPPLHKCKELCEMYKVPKKEFIDTFLTDYKETLKAYLR